MSDEARPNEPSDSLLIEEIEDPAGPVKAGTVLAGRYRVERLLGSGGMGAVYLSEHILMKKAVAVKVLHRGMTVHPEVVARFEQEAVAAARIDHPNVAAAMDFGRLEDGSFYLVLEYVGGSSLRTLIDQGPLPVERALAIGVQIAHALVAAHAAGIVHRDLKPDNVMLIPQPDGRDLAKVLDFGIAKVTTAGEAEIGGRALTRYGTVMGTAGYMAPEQALGTAVDARADLYSFGVVLYEALARKLPFEADEVAQILAKQLTEPPASLPPHVPAELTALLVKLLARSPDERVQTAAELVQALGRVVPLSPSEAALVAAKTEVMPAQTAPAVTAASGVTGDFPEAVKRAPSRATMTLVGLAAALLLALVATLYEHRASSVSAEAPSALPSSAVIAVGAPEPVTSIAPLVAVPSSVPSGVVPAPPKMTEKSEAHTTATTNGRTVTTRTTRRSSVEEHSTHVRRQRHGGLYIPPPSQWFK